MELIGAIEFIDKQLEIIKKQKQIPLSHTKIQFVELNL